VDISFTPQLLNQMDGFDELGKVKMVMATNRPDTLDPALLRPGRLDRKIEIPLPNDAGRMQILQIHSSKMRKQGDIGMGSIWFALKILVFSSSVFPKV
jgi:26S proteasome regulatory subunit T4